MSEYREPKRRLAAGAALVALSVALVGILPATARAGDDMPTGLQSFRACAEVKADAARLACYDKAAAAFDFDGTKKRLAETKKLQEEADRLRAEADARKAEAAKLKAEADARQAELVRAKAAEKARADADAREKAEQDARKVTDFGREDSPVKTVDRIESTIVNVIKPRVGSAQSIVVELENGQAWRQSDSKRPGVLRPGMKIHITKSPFSGYLMAIEDTNHSFHVTRLR